MNLIFTTGLFESLSLNNTVLDPTTHTESRWRVTAGDTVLFDTWLYGTADIATVMAAIPAITELSLTSIAFDYEDTDALLIEHWHRDSLGVISDPGEFTFSPCYEGWRVTFFEDDDVTAILGSSDSAGDVVQADFHTSATCPRPFLKWPTGISESEINFQEGRAKIGEMQISIVDKRTDPADQSTGIVTSIIEKLRDARCVVECFYNGEWRVVLNGAVASFRLNPSLVTWDISVRDIRERERDYRLFVRNDTFAVYPERGAANGYGFGAGEPFMPPAQAYAGTYVETLDAVTRRRGYVETDGFFEELEPQTRALGEPAIDSFSFAPTARYPQLTVRWRAADAGAAPCPGSPSTVRVQSMLDTAPSERLAQLETAYELANNGDPMPSDPNDLAAAAMGGDDCTTNTSAGAYLKRLFLSLVAIYGGEGGDWTYLRGSEMQIPAVLGAGNLFAAGDASIVDPGGLGVPVNYTPRTNRVRILLDGPDEDMPAPDAEIEVQVLAADVTGSTPLIWEGTFGRLLRLIYDGFFSDGAPRIWYDEDRMRDLELNTPIARLNKPKAEEDMRRWVEEHIYKVLGMAPAVDENGRIYPIAYKHPAAGSVLEVLDDDNVAADASWEAGDDGAISTVEFTYYRESRIPTLTPQQAVEKKSLFGIDWLKKDKTITVAGLTYDIVQREIRQVFLSSDVDNGKKITYKPDTVRVLSINGQALTGDTGDELGAQLAAARASEVMRRFVKVTPRITLRVRGSDAAAQAIAIGDHVRVTLSWLPDPDTGTRGCDRAMQVLALRPPLEDGWVRYSVIDAGPYVDTIAENLTVDPAPFFDDGLPTVTVTDVPAGYVGRIDMALAFTGEPEEGSPDWLPLATEITAPGVYQSPYAVPVDTPVWVRWRIEKAGEQPGDWSSPVEVTGGTAGVGGLFSSAIDLDMDTGDVTVRWTHGATVAGVRVYYDIVPDGDVPDLADDFVDVDATDGEVVLPESVTIGPDPFTVAVRIEPWDTFPIAGNVGAEQRRSIRYPGRDEIPATGGEVDALGDDLAAEIARATAAEAALAADIAAIVEESTTVSNTGAGAQVAKALAGFDIPHRTLVGTGGIVVTQLTDTIEIDGSGISGGSGEANTASNMNVGGVGVWKQKTGVDLEFRGIAAASSKVTVALDAGTNEIRVDVDDAELAIDWTQLTSVPSTFTAAAHALNDVAFHTGELDWTQLPTGSGTWDIGAGEAMLFPETINIGAAPVYGTGYNLTVAAGYGVLIENGQFNITCDAGVTPAFGMSAVGGTLASPTATPADTIIVQMYGQGYTGAAFASGFGDLRFVATALYTGASTPAHAELYGIAVGSTTAARMAKFALAGSTIDTALEVTGALTKGGVAVVLTNDARMTDARTPLAHTHAIADISHATAVAGSIPASIGAGFPFTMAQPSAANQVLRYNGLASGFALLTNDNIDAAAAIAWTKISKSGAVLDDLGGTLPYGKLPTGNGSWDTGAATTITITRNLTVSGTLTGTLTGRADTATALHTARTINGVSFNGTANIALSLTDIAPLVESQFVIPHPAGHYGTDIRRQRKTVSARITSIADNAATVILAFTVKVPSTTTRAIVGSFDCLVGVYTRAGATNHMVSSARIRFNVARMDTDRATVWSGFTVENVIADTEGAGGGAHTALAASQFSIVIASGANTADQVLNLRITNDLGASVALSELVLQGHVDTVGINEAAGVDATVDVTLT